MIPFIMARTWIATCATIFIENRKTFAINVTNSILLCLELNIHGNRPPVPGELKRKEMKMLPVKKILCPTDFSDPSFVGINTANELATHFSAELIIVHVVSPVHMYPWPDPSAVPALERNHEEMIKASHRSLEEVVKDKTSPELLVQTRVLQGSPADQIVDVAGSEEVDVIVTATHGWTGWRRYIFGSVAEKVVRLATCPVLTVPGPPVSGPNA